jgi:hypothetical protein
MYIFGAEAAHACIELSVSSLFPSITLRPISTFNILINHNNLRTMRKSVAQELVTSVLPAGDVPYDSTSSHEWNQDEETLAALGYKPEFKREFNLWTTFCVSFAVLGLLPSFASTLFYGMGYAGTAGPFISFPLLPSLYFIRS